MKFETHIGTVIAGDGVFPRAGVEYGDGSFRVIGTQQDLSLWANRPGERWPCSALAAIAAGGRVMADFDRAGDLVELEGAPEDLPSDELGAWVVDVLRAAGLDRLADEQASRVRSA